MLDGAMEGITYMFYPKVSTDVFGRIHVGVFSSKPTLSGSNTNAGKVTRLVFSAAAHLG